MKILVANIGSTSFKYRLYEMPTEIMLARGGVERIGAENSRSYILLGEETTERIGSVPDHGSAVESCLEQLTDPETGCVKEASEIEAIGFKVVHAKGICDAVVVDESVLEAMQAYVDVAPAHNPPYLRAMRQLHEKFPDLPLVAALETGFHKTIPQAHRYYAVPWEWCSELGVRRWGFHGASHRYISERIAELMGRDDLRVISCHLGGSSSLAAIQAGKSIGNSMGMSPQSGLPHNNRVGEFDVFALSALMDETGLSLDELLDVLANKSGLAGLSGADNDLRDIERAARRGNERAQLAIDVFVGSIRDYLGSYLVRLGGADAIVFTGGIGENSATIREKVCEGLEPFGIRLDRGSNQVMTKGDEGYISAFDSEVMIWVISTNEEIIVARQTYEAVGSE